jgi:hypothetical protein
MLATAPRKKNSKRQQSPSKKGVPSAGAEALAEALGGGRQNTKHLKLPSTIHPNKSATTRSFARRGTLF